MAQMIIAYEDDAGTKMGVSEEESLQNLWIDYAAAASISLTSPFNTTYTNLAALQAVSGWGSAIAAPSGLTPRKITLGVADGGGNAIATAQCVVGLPANYDAAVPTGATPYPTSPSTLTTASASVLGNAGEQRSSN